MAEEQVEYITPPPGMFFRVAPPDKDGDIQVALCRNKPTRWFERTHTEKLTIEYVYRSEYKYYDLRKLVRDTMVSILTKYEKRCAVDDVVGDYPPKRMPAK